MKKLALGVTALLCMLVLGCSSTTSTPTKLPEAQAAAKQDYTIGVSDALQVNVWKNPELSVAVPVRPDGKISLPLVGDIVAAGETSEQLAKNVSARLKNFIRNPQVTVIVTNPASSDFERRIRVTGAVLRPLSVPYRDGMTVLDMVLEAGGLTEFASANKSKLYRKVNGTIEVYDIYLNDILKKGRLVTNYALQPSDIVTVPERAF